MLTEDGRCTCEIELKLKQAKIKLKLKQACCMLHQTHPSCFDDSSGSGVVEKGILQTASLYRFEAVGHYGGLPSCGV